MKTFLFLLPVLFFSCSKKEFKEPRVFVGGQVVQPHTLNLGKQIYSEYCMACHGVKGDGNGPAARGSVPPPRNFTQGLYKFGWVKDGGLPTDEDFLRIIQKGLHGTAMLPWDISRDQTLAVIQYIKTFAPQVWEAKDGEPGIPIEVTKDPFNIARKDYAIEKGKEVYHVVANCQSCHRAYVTKEELAQLTTRNTGDESSADEFDDDIYKLKSQESEYYFYDSEERYAKYLPPDFTWHPLRSINSTEDIYKRLVAGVTGAGMPIWRDVITDEEIWAVSYYVKHLMEMKESKARKDLMDKLERQ